MYFYEKWLPVTGYENDYLISDFGRMRTLKYGKDVLMDLSVGADGYVKVGLRKDGKREFTKVHRLVAMHFIPNPLNLPVVNHKNGVPTDNRVSNLEWCTVRYNNKLRPIHNMGMYLGPKNAQSKLSEEDVLNIYNLAYSGTIAMKELANMYGVHIRVIFAIKSGEAHNLITGHKPRQIIKYVDIGKREE